MIYRTMVVNAEEAKEMMKHPHFRECARPEPDVEKYGEGAWRVDEDFILEFYVK